MQVDDIRRLVKIFQESDIDELEVSWGEGRTIRMTRRLGHQNGDFTSHGTPSSFVAPAMPVAPLVPESSPAAATEQINPAEAGLVEIRSPMVGTFYRAPSPGAPNYVEIGSRVEKGQVVCIVEAMKLMNEIEAEVSGVLVKGAVENGSPVEFNQTLFLVRPD
ncbi:MAG: acetyl-CoA carboxylase biotin carboxyl carrier protein [Candidatus Eisenbacteria bacterium]|uniref:Biotin carboxyl carrier protein of acetyl-CoA carboxylase n=1 Tax=Eiseniibacteriota bacterium TaxID=2212470 RepID=A0A956LYH9_UNCEI|nr:acetyl-CoA carboxylase biotin carboxyl carrier protein [Candidatus Eisenbacteria bacterium]